MRRRRIPGPKDYPGKCYVWLPESEARLLELVGSGLKYACVAEILNREFEQRVKLTEDSAIGKVWRLRGGKKRKERL